MDTMAKRDQIVAIKTAAATSEEIVKQLKVCRQTIYYAWKQFQGSGTTSRKLIPGRFRSVLTKIIVYAAKKKMERHPQGGFRKMAKYDGI